jgi:hypothetical protein
MVICKKCGERLETCEYSLSLLLVTSEPGGPEGLEARAGREQVNFHRGSNSHCWRFALRHHPLPSMSFLQTISGNITALEEIS